MPATEGHLGSRPPLAAAWPPLMVADVVDKTGTLPLLEFALTKLWEHQHAGWLTHEAYEVIGRVEGAACRCGVRRCASTRPMPECSYQ